MFGWFSLYQLISHEQNNIANIIGPVTPSLAKRKVYKEAVAMLLVLSDERTNIF